MESLLPLGLIEALAASPYGMFAVPAALLLLTTAIVSLSVPGALTPTAFLSGLLMGFGGVLVVAAGAVVGNAILFIASRRWLGGYMRRRFGERIDRVHEHLLKRGPVYVVTARLVAVPHGIVTAACAAAPISLRAFLAASLLGMLPGIVLGASAGTGLALL